MMNEKVTIIMLNYNQNNYTIKSVESILNSVYPDFELLLVDNGSEPENFQSLQDELPKDNRLKVLRIKDNVGYVGGSNYGMKEALKSNPFYLLIMNNDTIIDPHAVTELVKTCQIYKNNAIVTGKVYHYDDPERLQYVGHKILDKKMLLFQQMGVNELDKGQYDSVEARAMLDDIFWLLPVKLYQQMGGGYSQYFWFNYEQMDFAIRAKKIGYQLIYTPNAKLWHKGSVSIGGRDENPKQAYWAMQGELIFKYLHLDHLHFIKFYLKTMFRIMRTFIKALYRKILKNDDYMTFAILKFKGWMYFNKWMLNKQKNTGVCPLDNGA